MLLLLAAAAWGDCPATSADLLDTLIEAERAFGQLELDAFRVATAAATADVACLDEVLPRPVAARLHRIEGLRAFVLDDDAVAASAAFASARAIEPSYRFPEALVPTGHPVRERYEQQDPKSGGESAVPAPADGQIEVDGVPGAGLPRTRPSVVQWVRADGSVPASAYLRPGEALFDYPPAPTGSGSGVAGLPGSEGPTAKRAHTSVPMAVGAGVMLLAAAGAYAVAADARGDYLADDATLDELDPLRSRTNTFFAGAVGLGTAGVGLGVGAVLVGKW
jgi:hypothetical protein